MTDDPHGRPQDITGDGATLTFQTGEHDEMMSPQAITVTDALGRSRVYVPARADDPARVGPVIEPLEDARAALRMIREAVETLAPTGALPSREQTGVNMTEEAEAIVRGIRTIAGMPV